MKILGKVVVVVAGWSKEGKQAGVPHIRMAAKSKAALHEKSHGSMVKHFVDKPNF